MGNWRFVKRAEINDVTWDACVEKSIQEHVYGYTWFLDVVTESWQGFIYGDYDFVFPVPLKRKAGLTYVYQAPFIQRTAVYGTSTSIPAETQLLELVLRNFLRIDLTVLTPFGLEKKGKSMQNFILNLSADYDGLKQGFSKNTKRNIDKGQRAGLMVKQVDSKQIVQAGKIFKEQSRYTLSEEWYTVLSELVYLSQVNLYAVLKEQEVLGYALIACSRQRKVLLFTALTEEGKKKGAMHFLLSELIKKWSGKSLYFDFEGSQNTGVARFYKGFGSQKEVYYHIQKKLSLKSLNPFAKKV